LAFTLYLASALYAQADAAVFEAGVQVGALDERDALREKPVIAGGHAGVRLWRFVGAEAEINRLPIGGAAANFPATEFLFGAKLGYRIGRSACSVPSGRACCISTQSAATPK
jgi:hypothetical protein